MHCPLPYLMRSLPCTLPPSLHLSLTQGDIANEAVAGGAAGLAFIRVQEGGQVDCAKPIKEGLSQEQVGAGWALGRVPNPNNMLVGAGGC